MVINFVLMIDSLIDEVEDAHFQQFVFENLVLSRFLDGLVDDRVVVAPNLFLHGRVLVELALLWLTSQDVAKSFLDVADEVEFGMKEVIVVDGVPVLVFFGALASGLAFVVVVRVLHDPELHKSRQYASPDLFEAEDLDSMRVYLIWLQLFQSSPLNIESFKFVQLQLCH